MPYLLPHTVKASVSCVIYRYCSRFIVKKWNTRACSVYDILMKC